METRLLNLKGEEVGKVELKDDVFGLKPRKDLLHEFVTLYLANQRRGTAHVKTRAEVSGSGKKPWKQKHTGRARAGSIRSPLWRHGGVTWGPRTHSMRLDMPRQKARLILAHALSVRSKDGSLLCVESLSVEDGKTKSVAALLKNLQCSGKVLLVLDAPNTQLSRGSRNIPEVQIAMAHDLNAYSVLRCKKLVMTKAAMEKLAARWN
jgi:large subunit ribosomal protein L4